MSEKDLHPEGSPRSEVELLGTPSESDVVLRDGGTAHVRPLSPDDIPALEAFYARVSSESKYARFFTSAPELSAREWRQLTDVDHLRRVGLGVTLGADIIATGHYAAVGDDQAEVSFLVEDAHQGRGIAHTLLEHLAERGRAVGLREFVAEVLPGNHRMLAAFADAGYAAERTDDEGAIHVALLLDPTARAQEVVEARDHIADAASVARLMRPRSVAVVGATRRDQSVGGTLLRHLRQGGFAGPIHVVNPGAATAPGEVVYQRVGEIHGPVDLAVIAVPAALVEEVVADCAAHGVHAVIVVSAGFADIGEEGRSHQRDLVAAARASGLRVLGPNALGLIVSDPEVRLNASLSPYVPPLGRLSFFCQSGALGAAILEQVVRRGIGLASFVSAGNRADLSGNDFLQYWEDDAATEVVLLYLESLGNPRKFSRIARRVSRVKPIVAVRSGRKAQGVPLGHAVRELDVPDAAVDAMFRQAGVIVADSLQELLDIGQVLAHQPLPRGTRLAVVSNSDALSILAEDAAVTHGWTLAECLNVGPTAGAVEFGTSLGVALANPDVDAVLVINVPPVNTASQAVAEAIAAVAQSATKPVVSSFLGTEGVPAVLRAPGSDDELAERGSIPSYSTVEGAVVALAKARTYAEWLATPTEEEIPDRDLGWAHQVIDGALKRAPGGTTLDLQETTMLLSSFGIDLFVDASTAHEGEWSEVLRPTSAGVPVRIVSEEDPFFGPVLGFCLAGSLSDLIRDESFRVPPLSPQEARSMVTELKTAQLFAGYLGSRPVDLDRLAHLLVCVAAMQHELPQIRRLELAPVLAAAEGTIVMGARIEVGPYPSVRPQTLARSLTAPVETV